MKIQYYVLAAAAFLLTAPVAFATDDVKQDHDARAQEAFTKHDADKDGKLTLDEFKSLEKARWEQRKAHKRDKLTKNPEFVKKHDTNSDGKIDDAEFQAALKDKHSKRDDS